MAARHKICAGSRSCRHTSGTEKWKVFCPKGLGSTYCSMRHDIIVQSMSCLNCYGNVVRLVFTKIAARPVCTCFADELLNLNSNGCTVNLTTSSYCISSGCFALYKGGSYHVKNEPSLPVEEEQRMTSCTFKMSSLPVEGQQGMRSFSFAGICCFLHLTSSFFYFNCVDFPTISRLICMQGLF